MKKKILSENKLRKRYFILKTAFVVLLILFGTGIYFSYDYLAFRILTSNYIYTDTLDEIYEEALGDSFKGYYKDFDRMMIAVVTEKIRVVGGDRYTYLYNPDAYKYSKEQEKTQAATARMEALTEDTVYVSLPNISKYTWEFISENREEINSYEKLVLDLRSNRGGGLSAMYKIAGLFLNADDVISYEKAIQPIFSKTIKAKGAQYFQFEQIVILLNENTASAAEGLTMALRENMDNVTTMGTGSFGKGISQITIPLTAGYAVKATIATVHTPSGGSIHLTGIEPDIIYEGEDILNEVLLNGFKPIANS